MQIRILVPQANYEMDLFFVSIQSEPPFPDYVVVHGVRYEFESVITHNEHPVTPHYTLTYTK